MKKLFIATLILAFCSSVSANTAPEVFRCVSTPTSITGDDYVHWNTPQVTYTTRCVTNAIEYEWTLNVNTTCAVSQTSLTPNITISPNDFSFFHGGLCGDWTISVRAKIDDGVNPPYYTAYFTMGVTVYGC